MGLEIPEFLLAFLVVVIGAVLQGSIGFGLALVAAPVLVMLDPRLVPGPLIVIGLPFMFMLAWKERASVDYQTIWLPLAGQVAGMLVALVLLHFTDERSISLIVALVVLLGVGLSVSGLEPKPGTRSFLLGGGLAGFMGTTSAMPGPALALVYQHLPPARMRGTLAPFFIIGSAAGLTGLVLAGEMNWEGAVVGFSLIPATLVGFAVSFWTAPRVKESFVRPAVLVFALLAALGLLYRSL